MDNINNLRQQLSNINWREALEGRNPNECYTDFVNTFNKLYDECIPMKKI